MKNSVGKNIARLRKERKLSQEQLATILHVTRQAVSNWETERSQPDLDMLEALASALQTDILAVIYGQVTSQEHAEIKVAERYRHLRLAVVAGVIALLGGIFSAVISKYLKEAASKTFEPWPYLMFRNFASPLVGTVLGVAMMHMLSLVNPVRISDTGVRKKILVLGIALVSLYALVTLWVFGLLPIPIGIPVWIWRLLASIFPQVLFFFIGIFLYLGLEK